MTHSNQIIIILMIILSILILNLITDMDLQILLLTQILHLLQIWEELSHLTRDQH